MPFDNRRRGHLALSWPRCGHAAYSPAGSRNFFRLPRLRFFHRALGFLRCLRSKLRFVPISCRKFIAHFNLGGLLEETGRRVGMKPAGGIRQAKQAVQYLVQLHETLGPEWLTPDLYRMGASSLLNDVLMQIRKEKTGRYQSPDYFTVD